MATVPLSGTNIRLLSGVPFSNDYKNTRWFDTQSQQYSYFNSKPVVHNELQQNFQRIEFQTFIRVDKSIDELHGVNYLMFQNAQYNDKWFYAFVTKLEYKNKAVTYVHFQLDVFQTWCFNMNFKPSFVVREHRKLWNADGSPVINTVDEGLAYGTDYETKSVEKVVPFSDIYFLVIISKETMHGGTAGKKEITPVLNGSPQPLTYYLHPFKLDGSAPKTTLDGIEINISKVTDVLKSLYTQEDAVNNIVGLYVTEFPGITVSQNGDTLEFNMANFDHALIQDDSGSFNTLYLKSQRSYGNKIIDLGDKYAGLDKPTESKLLMHPYTSVILDDFKGHRIELKNEYIHDPNLKLIVRGAFGTSRVVAYHLEHYLNTNLTGGSIKIASGMEHGIVSNNPSDVPIITDLLSAYLQGNRNSIANQSDSIYFNGAMNNINAGVNAVTAPTPQNLTSSLSSVIQGTGNTVLAIQGLEAKQKDINNVPPSMSSMGSNTAFDFGNGYTGLYVIKKQISNEYLKKLSDFFNMFGYKTNEVKVPNFHTRKNWNYVQTESCIITGNFNNEDLVELKHIFDSGITLWHTDDVGNYSLANGVL